MVFVIRINKNKYVVMYVMIILNFYKSSVYGICEKY